MPSQEEMDEGRRNLEENDYIVDFIVSHCSAFRTVAFISCGRLKPDMLTIECKQSYMMLSVI